MISSSATIRLTATTLIKLSSSNCTNACVGFAEALLDSAQAFRKAMLYSACISVSLHLYTYKIHVLRAKTRENNNARAPSCDARAQNFVSRAFKCYSQITCVHHARRGELAREWYCTYQSSLALLLFPDSASFFVFPGPCRYHLSFVFTDSSQVLRYPSF